MSDTDPKPGAGEQAARVAFDDLASLNLDNYDGLDLPAIGLLLAELAGRATASQLETILDGPLSHGEGDEGDKPTLVARYVAWRLETVERLRNLQRTLVIEGLD
jgi:hypothetical protein